MCPGWFWSCCAYAVGLCVHLDSEAPGRCHLTVHVHTSILRPRDLGLAARSHSARVQWPFLGDFPTPCSQKSGKIPCGAGGRTKRERQTDPKLMCWVYSCLRPRARQAVRCFKETSRLGLANGPPRAEVPLIPGAQSGTGARVVRQISRRRRGKVSRLTRENLAFLH